MYRNAPIASPLALSFDRGTLLLRGAGPQEMISADPARLWEWDSRVTAYRCDAIHYAAVRSHLQLKFGPRFRDLLPPPSRVAFTKIDLPTLRPEQQQAVTAWQTAGHRGMVVMPTGTGKTEVALAAMAAMRVSTLIVAPVRDLMHQWHLRILRRLGCDAGIVGDSILNIQPITVTTYDSAYARMPEMGDRFGLIIFDEAHHLPGRSYREAAMFSSAPMRLGLTATPDRADGRHVDLDTLIGPVVYRQEIAEAKGNTLADYEIVRIPVKLSDAEQGAYDAASRTVQSFLIECNRAAGAHCPTFLMWLEITAQHLSCWTALARHFCLPALPAASDGRNRRSRNNRALARLRGAQRSTCRARAPCPRRAPAVTIRYGAPGRMPWRGIRSSA